MRSNERAYTALTRLCALQAKEKPVVLVTKSKLLIEDTLIRSVDTFFEQELRARKKHHYPPFTDMIKLTIADASMAKAEKKAGELRKILKVNAKEQKDIYIRGPFSAFQKERKKKYEFHILLLGPLKKLTPLYADIAITRAELSPEKII